MSEFKKTVLTEKGLALLAKGQVGAVINFDRLVIGDGAYTGDLTKLTSLQNETKSLPILSITVDGVTTRIKGQLDNSGVITGYYIREIGVIATDPDEGEILYAVSNVGDGSADYIPPEASNIVEELFEFATKIENVENVTATLDSSIVYASKEELDAVTESINTVSISLDTVSKTVNDTTNDLDPITPAVNGQILTIITKSTIKKITLKIEADITGGPITIIRNGAGAKPLLTSNDEAVSELLAERMYADVIEEDTAFLYAPRGGGLKPGDFISWKQPVEAFPFLEEYILPTALGRLYDSTSEIYILANDSSDIIKGVYRGAYIWEKTFVGSVTILGSQGTHFYVQRYDSGYILEKWNILTGIVEASKTMSSGLTVDRCGVTTGCVFGRGGPNGELSIWDLNLANPRGFNSYAGIYGVQQTGNNGSGWFYVFGRGKYSVHYQNGNLAADRNYSYNNFDAYGRGFTDDNKAFIQGNNSWEGLVDNNGAQTSHPIIGSEGLSYISPVDGEDTLYFTGAFGLINPKQSSGDYEWKPASDKNLIRVDSRFVVSGRAFNNWINDKNIYGARGLSYGKLFIGSLLHEEVVV